LLDIAIAYDDNTSLMSWDVQLVDDVGGSDNVVLKVHKGVPDDAYQLQNGVVLDILAITM
jgi:hypothetical protein